MSRVIAFSTTRRQARAMPIVKVPLKNHRGAEFTTLVDDLQMLLLNRPVAFQMVAKLAHRLSEPPREQLKKTSTK